ncbi:hypothetical protein L323_13115 [Ruminiclostridium papyrosolvens C7]|uniref:Uncharacterized protein n=1 Tax=Ruminiclostridium papyrosolvens C7 TaxID=1330534 RepID=U4R1H5_9FIRM|nr:hypothetical protein L323_13115 [Ruminiclostridium papyrosolvens C7]
MDSIYKLKLEEILKKFSQSPKYLVRMKLLV